MRSTSYHLTPSLHIDTIKLIISWHVANVLALTKPIRITPLNKVEMEAISMRVIVTFHGYAPMRNS